jgi:hypothetical protein
MCNTRSYIKFPALPVTGFPPTQTHKTKPSPTTWWRWGPGRKDPKTIHDSISVLRLIAFPRPHCGRGTTSDLRCPGCDAPPPVPHFSRGGWGKGRRGGSRLCERVTTSPPEIPGPPGARGCSRCPSSVKNFQEGWSYQATIQTLDLRCFQERIHPVFLSPQAGAIKLPKDLVSSPSSVISWVVD